jgi:hypothetical protein
VISSYATAGPPDALDAQRNKLQTKRQRLQLEMISLQGKVESLLILAKYHIELNNIEKQKRGRKKMELAGFAKNRIQKLATVGISTARQLLTEYRKKDSTAMSKLKEKPKHFLIICFLLLAMVTERVMEVSMSLPILLKSAIWWMIWKWKSLEMRLLPHLLPLPLEIRLPSMHHQRQRLRILLSDLVRPKWNKFGNTEG